MLDSLLQKGKRANLVKELTGKFVFGNEVLDAIKTVPRHLFVAAGLEHLAYEDRPLPIAAGQTISQPSTVAMQTSLLGLKRWDKVLEVGTGCGYQTAILAEMGLRVYSMERQKELYMAAQKNLARTGYDKPLLFLGDGYAGLPQFAPFKGILVTCGVPRVPEALLMQLEVGGRMVIPLGDQQQGQELSVITRKSEFEFDKSNHGRYNFVPMLDGVCR